MKLLDVCKSGFYSKKILKPISIIKHPTHNTADEDIMLKISSLVLHPTRDNEVRMVLKINIPFLEAFKILGEIIHYAHTIPTLDFVQFYNIQKSDLYALTTTVLKSYQTIPFKINEICYYPRNACFDASMKVDNSEYINRYIVRKRWDGLFQRLFKTTKFNIIFSEEDNNDKT